MVIHVVYIISVIVSDGLLVCLCIYCLLVVASVLIVSVVVIVGVVVVVVMVIIRDRASSSGIVSVSVC